MSEWGPIRFFLLYVSVGTMTVVQFCMDGRLSAFGVLFTIGAFWAGCDTARRERWAPKCATCRDTGWIWTNYPNGPEVQCSCPDCNDATHELLDEYMCPNCVTPWKCNGPHIPA